MYRLRTSLLCMPQHLQRYEKNKETARCIGANELPGCYLTLGGTNFVNTRTLCFSLLFLGFWLSEELLEEIAPSTSSNTESVSEQVVPSFEITNPVVIWLSLVCTLSYVSCKAFGLLVCLQPVVKVIPKATPITVTAFPAFRSRLS